MTVTRSVEIVPGVIYTIHPDHRNNTARKSQWRVTEDQEIACFNLSWRNEWIGADVGWGLHIVDNRAEYLGVGQDHLTPVFMAKFKNDNVQPDWHGYPVDHTRNCDRPLEPILRRWMDLQFIAPEKMSKILRGKPCRL
jgi:hypothetical protein